MGHDSTERSQALSEMFEMMSRFPERFEAGIGSGKNVTISRDSQQHFHVVLHPRADNRFPLRDGAASAGDGAAPREKKPAASCVALRGGARKGRTGGFLASTGSSRGVRLADLTDSPAQILLDFTGF